MSRPDQKIFRFFVNNGVGNFVETGTFHGGGVSMPLRSGFSRIISIEAVSQFHQECTAKYVREIEAGRVTLVLGDRGENIDEVCKRLEGPILYWLDAHFQGGRGRILRP
jgi:hypothetical protein